MKRLIRKRMELEKERARRERNHRKEEPKL